MAARGRACLYLLSFVFVHGSVLIAQRSANSNAYYQQLRKLLPGGEIVNVNQLELHRDAATFTFQKGNFAFYGEVNGKVTGAVFEGQGHLHVTPPTAQERHNLALSGKSEEFDEDFDEAVLRFTDSTATELRKGAAGRGTADPSYVGAAIGLQSFARHQLHDNLDLRLLEDVLSPASGGYFLAAIHGKKRSHQFFILDPCGAEWLAPEEVALLNWSSTEEKVSYPLAFHNAAEYANGTATGSEGNAAYKILTAKLDVSIEKNGFLTSLATIEVRAEKDGLAVVPLNLYPTLRVSNVRSGREEPLDFVQERKDDDPTFGVILGQPLKKGETTTLKIDYAGKDVILNEGGGNYYPVARENWFPSSFQGLGNYATYKMLFHVPKGLQLIATGTKVHESTDGKITTSEWKTDVPLPVVGFSLGDFLSKDAKFGTPFQEELEISAYANTDVPDFVRPLANQGLGTLSTVPMLANELSQGEVAAQIYTDYFGQLPFSHISLTQQSACNYGQSWPMLVYLPICGFFDDTQRHFLGLGGENLGKHMYWRVVTPHEVAHQWWGQTVGFRSYRDQWMSEGFADASAAIFLQATRPKSDEFRAFWKEERAAITEKNAFGFRPIDVGPVTMGVRLSSPKAGWDVYDSLVYPKGAYILHMIRMMMWSPKEQDERFKATMREFVARFRMQAATTEDFKAIVEKHMSPQMDLDENRRMDWFFNQYVYGTDLPVYHFESHPTQDPNEFALKLTQAGVPANFKMIVPVYLELTDGHVFRLCAIPIGGTSTYERTITLPKLPAPVKKMWANYYYDVLSTEN